MQFYYVMSLVSKTYGLIHGCNLLLHGVIVALRFRNTNFIKPNNKKYKQEFEVLYTCEKLGTSTIVRMQKLFESPCSISKIRF